MESRTLFIKPSKALNECKKLDPVLVASNKSQGIETTITLDTNILISMEKVVDNGNKWSSVKRQGLHNLVKLLQKCPPMSVCLSPGLAFNEMPPELASQSQIKYEQFCSVHLPGFVDTPNCSNSKYEGKKDNYGYSDLSPEAKSVIAIPFACILYLNLIDNKFKGKAIEKFKLFLDKLESKVDVLSTAEIEIAKYCFAEPPSDCRETIELRKKIRNNFLKTNDNKLPRNFSEVMTIAFNGACDIHLLQASNILDYNGLDGVNQDTWVATKDKKLVDFCSVFHHINLAGDVGAYAVHTIHPEHLKDIYWSKVNTEFSQRSLSRLAYNQSRDIDLTKMVVMAEEVISEVKMEFG